MSQMCHLRSGRQCRRQRHPVQEHRPAPADFSEQQPEVPAEKVVETGTVPLPEYNKTTESDGSAAEARDSTEEIRDVTEIEKEENQEKD